MKYPSIQISALLLTLTLVQPAFCGIPRTMMRETAESIMSKFGKGTAGQTVEELTEATAKVVTRYGDDALPLVRQSGHAGFTALESAGAKAPDIIKLYARKGDEAIWIISEPKKLAIFVKYGDSAAEALLKHPNISDTLIGQYGDDAVNALNKLSRQSAQRLGIVADNGLLTATNRSSELLPVVSRYGDGAMDFIWKNKGSLAVASVLATFLANPQIYISGAKELIVDPLVSPIIKSIDWTPIVAGILGITFLPFIVSSIAKAFLAMKSKKKS